ncbi:MAG: metallophosphoesterase [Anaerolineales bacterium]
MTRKPVAKALLLMPVAVLGGLAVGSLLSHETAQAQVSETILVGASDIASCSYDRDESTAQLLDVIPGTVITMGDNVYPSGSPSQFNNCYASTWGRHKARTRPSPGNHAYYTAGAAGYYTYFGAAASPLEPNCTSNCKGYYSYDLGAWHIIALNSEIALGAGSEQEQWLRADLAANPNSCTLAYWHKPRFSSGSHGNDTSLQAIWQALYDYGADVVLNGHDHTYERFAPQSPTGQSEPTRGIREFVVGTGGASLYSFPSIKPNSEVHDNTTWGVLKLTLRLTSYDWEFVPIAGQTFTDAGSANCVTLGPTPTSTSTATPNASATPTDLPPSPTVTAVPPTATPAATMTDAPPAPTNITTPPSTSTPSLTSTNVPMPVDLNLDGRVDVLDVQLSVNVFLGTETDPGIVGRSDVNGDSAVDVLDVQLVVNQFLSG